MMCDSLLISQVVHGLSQTAKDCKKRSTTAFGTSTIWIESFPGLAIFFERVVAKPRFLRMEPCVYSGMSMRSAHLHRYTYIGFLPLPLPSLFQNVYNDIDT